MNRKRMGVRSTVIFLDDFRCRIFRAGAVTEVAATPAAVATALTAVGATGDVVLALPWSWCLSATVGLGDVPARQRRRAVLYRLELLLPLDAEDTAADFIPADSTALAIGVSIRRVKPWVDRLEADGWSVSSVVPWSITAAQDALTDPLARQCDVLIWQTPDGVELFPIRRGTIVGWFVLPAEIDGIRDHLSSVRQADSSEIKIAALDLDPTFSAAVATIDGVRIAHAAARSMDQACLSRLAAGAATVELRRQRLAPSDPYRSIRAQLVQASIAAAVFAGLVCFAAVWRAVHLQAIVASHRDRQAALYREVFPNRPVPPNVLSRLRSEDRRLSTVPDADPSDNASAIPTLRDVLLGLGQVTPGVKFQTEELTARPLDFMIQGTIGPQTDPSQLLDAVSSESRLRLDPPRLERVDGDRLRITVTGTRGGAPKP